jgi:S1-C subfamily serine protease
LAVLAVLAAAAAFGGFAATALQSPFAPAEARDAAGAAAVPAMAASLPSAVAGTPLPSLAPMLKRVLPAVVSVHSTQRVRINNPFADDPLFQRMFPNVPKERIAQSLGSGVIVDGAHAGPRRRPLSRQIRPAPGRKQQRRGPAAHRRGSLRQDEYSAR